jgi:hypothetical protein
LRIREAVALWTDDFSNIFSVFLWSFPRLVPMTGSVRTEGHLPS